MNALPSQRLQSTYRAPVRRSKSVHVHVKVRYPGSDNNPTIGPIEIKNIRHIGVCTLVCYVEFRKKPISCLYKRLVRVRVLSSLLEAVFASTGEKLLKADHGCS